MRPPLFTTERYRHVVFPPTVVRRPLNLGLPPDEWKIEPFGLHETENCELIEAVNDEEAAFCAWLFARAGLSARHYRPAALRRRMPACLRALRASSITQARRILHANPSLFQVAVDVLLLGVTGFFRDGPVFTTLFKHLAGKLAQPMRPLRIWSVACSEGMELYSVAMMLAEVKALGQCELLGTDCRPDAIRRAREGLYSNACLRQLPADLLLRYFEPPGDCAVGGRIVSSSLRQATHWQVADALKELPHGSWDVILCRNMAMYLQPMASDRLWRNLYDALSPGGYLVVGKAERPASLGAAIAHLGACVYQKSNP